MKQARIFIISGPGGAGKTTLLNKLFRKEQIQKSFMKGISITTRPKRPQEKDGKDYFFVSKEEFSKLEKKKFFLESQKILDDHYGTPKILYLLAKRLKKGLILCLDVKGAMYLKKSKRLGKIVTIFIGAPTEKDLYRRMKKRVEARDVAKRRVKLAKKEVQFSKRYDFLVVNKDIRSTLRKLEKIIPAD